AAIALICVGLYIGFFIAPTDFQQGDSYRIIFVHVPAAWMSMFLYVVMAIWAGLGLGLNARPSFMMAQAIAPTGAMFTFLALLTGAMWWKTLHQGASVTMTESKMATPMVAAMLIMMLGFWMYSFAVTLARMRCVILDRERQPSWSKHSSIHEVVEAR